MKQDARQGLQYQEAVEKRYRQKYRRKQGILFLLCLCLAIGVSGCGAQPQPQNVAMGRYVEARLPLPEAGRSIGPLMRSDGSLEVYYEEGQPDNSYRCYTSRDSGQTWELQERCFTLPQKENLSRVCYDTNETRYLLAITYTDTENTYVYRQEADGRLTEIPIQWKAKEGGVPGTESSYIYGVAVLDNGDFVFQQMGMGIVQYGSDGTFRRTLGGPRHADYGIASAGNSIYAVNEETSAVECYDGESGQLLRSIPYESTLQEMMLFCDADGSLCMSSRSGIFYMAAGGELWERVVDATITSLSVPSLYFSNLSMAKSEQGDVYYLYGSNMQESYLYCYSYDPDVPAVPEEELVIYSLRESNFLRQVAGEFQQQHPDVRVTIQTAIGGDEMAATSSELIRSLNAELAAGKGPDLLLLDGLPATSYIEKGILADLSDVLAAAEKENQLNETVVRTYEADGEVCAIPMKLKIPVLLLERELLQQEELQRIEELGLEALAALAQAHPEQPLIGTQSGQRLMECFFPVCAPAWITQDGLQEEGLSKYLYSLKQILDASTVTYAGAEMAGDLRDTDDLFHWAFGRSLCTVYEPQSMSSLMSLFAAVRQRGEAELILLPGQAQGVYRPVSVMGINAKSEHRELAEAFICMALAQEAQSESFHDGFPVNEEALKSQAADFDENIYFSMGGYSYDENESLGGGDVTPEEKQRFATLLGQVQTPYLADEQLAQLISEQAEGYFSGEKSLKQAVKDIEEATKLYLSE